MKRLLLACCVVLAAYLNAQSDFTYSLSVTDTKGAPKTGLPVSFIEKGNYERIEKVTDVSGKLTMHFDHGQEWSVSIGDMADYAEIRTPGSGSGSAQVTYDLVSYERRRRLLPDRRSISFTRIPQNIPPGTMPNAAESVVRIILENKQKAVFPNVPVVLTCFAAKKQYTASTNSAGEAIFLVPVKSDYEIDVDGIESIRYADLGERPGIKTITLLYEKRQFTEKTTNGYKEQAFKPGIVASSSHARVELHILRGGSPLANEPVYLRTVKSSDMYRAKTDASGTVIFMLPVKGKYLVDLTFQRDAGVVDLSRVEGIANMSVTVDYKPDPRLEYVEDFIPRVRDLVDYDIESFLDAQYPEPQQDVELFMKWGNKFNASSKESLLEIGFKVKRSAGNGGVPKNLSLVVDISGSMSSEDRLELVKRNLTAIISKLSSVDRVSLVVFDHAATLAYPSTLMSDKKPLLDIIAMLRPGGGTNIYNGLVLGLEEMMKNRSPKYASRLILLTDGYCSVEPGVTIAKAKEYIAEGAQISTIGVGTDYNKALLSMLASTGGGELEMAGSAETIDKAFQKAFGKIVSPVGENVRLEVLYNDRIVYRQLFGYANEKVSPGKMQVAFDHLFPGLEKMALVKFDIINSSQEIEKQPVKARLVYTDVATKKEKIVEKELYPVWTTATGELDMSLDRNHKKVLATAIANQSLKNMANAFEAGDREGAEKAARSGMDQIAKLFPGATPPDLENLIKELSGYVSVFGHLANAHSSK
jgi:hypothetical protein